MENKTAIHKYKGFRTEVTYSAEDKVFIGKVIDIPDSLNFHGSSKKECTSMFHQSIDNYLALCKKINKYL